MNRDGAQGSRGAGAQGRREKGADRRLRRRTVHRVEIRISRSFPSPLRGLLLAACCLVVTGARADVVERRGAEPAVQGTVTLIDEAGVVLRSPLGAVHFIPWDRVRSVQTDRTDPTLAARMKTAVDLWRARSRVERHDTTLAEPVLERLFEMYHGSTHETALVVAEGLLRCRVARADQVLAVIPALDVARLRRAGVTTHAYATLDPEFDTQYALCIVVAAVWLPSPRLELLARDLAAYDAQGDEVVEALANEYRNAVLRTLGRTPDPAATSIDHPGIDLMKRLNACRSEDPDTRSAAREQLRRAIPKMPPWAEAWARYQIGVSLLAEKGIGRRQKGAVSLIHLPARFNRTHPFLAGLALAEVAAALETADDAAAAATLRSELNRIYPNHPLHASSGAPSGG